MVHRIHPSSGGESVGKRRRTRRLAAAAGVLAATALIAAPVAFSAQAPVGLGTDGSFAVLAGSTVTNTGPSVISGSVGLDPGSAVIGFPPGIVTATVSGDLAGRTLTSGVYTSASSLGLSGALTLDAQGDPNAVFVFQAGSSLIVGSSSQVNLIGGAQACNVYWQVGSSATIGTGAAFVGNILALTSISMTTGATLQGRALARNGAVTLDTNTITSPLCTGGSSGTSIPGTTTTGGSTTTGTGATTGTGTTKPKPKPKPKHKVKPKTKATKPTSHKPKVVKPKPAARVPKPVTPTPVIPTAPKPPAFTG
jgi:hypothetical protein